MLDRTHSERIIRKAIAASDADHLEISISGGKNALTRFANNEIHQNLIQKDYSLSVRATYGGKSGIATSNVFKGEDLAATVNKACEIARHSDDDPDFLPPEGNHEYPYIDDCYMDDTVECTPQIRAEIVARIVEKARAKGLVTAGTLSTGDAMICLGNTSGQLAYHSWTDTSFTLTMTNDQDGTSWAERIHPDLSAIDFDELTDRAIRVTALNRNPGTIEDGEYNVLLSPEAVGNMIMFLGYLGFSAQDYIEGRTFLTEQLNQKVFGENFSLVDDPFDPDSPGIPFDSEGIPRRRTVLVDKGVACGMVHDRSTAAKLKAEPTGHATPMQNSWGPVPRNLRVSPGEVPEAEMVERLGNGIYICNFFYDNVVDPLKARITGMTKDGMFLVENGKIVKALGRMRYNASLLDAFSRIEAMSRELHTLDRGAMKTLVPSMIIKGLHLSA
ncbi:MAG: hypothetical protein CVV64_13135 [Candidatus Wallbacteria bacterium HGW-Wallbacteria-1]|jgi:predicted Zn-dependent protease|uniref:TldD/PmbA family protein n=1 Tax=Candidatus Wallbacteria bacterium HGW-Wallbacteria-1 TaxID=2013854 RepID=A0A2N1PN06_9BACT|nr:MAG: hypothetical protein CVV64_13135 [Candidatus Wallbacteria bacterium HGW-Wallbacteria-1]